jgi:hypothetical protein
VAHSLLIRTPLVFVLLMNQSFQAPHMPVSMLADRQASAAYPTGRLLGYIHDVLDDLGRVDSSVHA